MQVDIVVETQGLDRAIANLRGFPSAVATTCIAGPLRAGAEVMRRVIAAAVPVSHSKSHPPSRPRGYWRSQIRVTQVRSAPGRVIGFVVNNGGAFYAWFQERGYHSGKRTTGLKRAYKKAKTASERQSVWAKDTRKWYPPKRIMERAGNLARGPVTRYVERRIVAAVNRVIGARAGRS